MQRQVRRLSDPLDDEGAVRIKHRLAVTAHLARHNRASRPAAAVTTSQPTRPQHQTVPPPTGSSRPPEPTPPHAREDPRKEDGSCEPSQHLESQTAENRNLEGS